MAETPALDLLASALAGRELRVVSTGPGEPAWTDGSAIHVDTAATPCRQRLAIGVHSALLAAGSLDPDILRRLSRRPRAARRYLAVEGQRALATLDDILPPTLASLIDRPLAARSTSAFASLQLALGAEALPDPPGAFGEIRPRALLDAAGG